MRTTVIILLPLLLLATSASGEFNREPTPEAAAWLQEVEAYKQSIHGLDPYAREALALNPEADFSARYEAIQSLAEDPSAHLNALEQLMDEPLWTLRFAAIKIIESQRPAVAYMELSKSFDELIHPQKEKMSTDAFRILESIALMARMGDRTKLPYVKEILMQSTNNNMVKRAAIRTLSSFYYFKELKPYKPLIAFVDKTLPEFANAHENSKGKLQRLISYALYKLAGLNAVETIPDFERWQSDSRIGPIRDAVNHNLRRLQTMQDALDRGEPDPRDAINITPGTAPAWKLPTGVRD